MPLKLRESEDKSISIDDMGMGQVARLVKWGNSKSNIGDLLYRGTNSRWYNLTNGECWATNNPGVDKWDDDDVKDHRVVVLPVGTRLTVVD